MSSISFYFWAAGFLFTIGYVPVFELFKVKGLLAEILTTLMTLLLWPAILGDYLGK